MTKRMNIGERLDAIKEYKGFSSDAELARQLGISKQRMYSWRTRDVWDVTTILKAFPELQPAWLDTGEGDMNHQGTLQALKLERVKELLRQKDEIIERQAQHIKMLTKELEKHL